MTKAARQPCEDYSAGSEHFVTVWMLLPFLQEISLEVLLLVGLFMLGGEFWDKLRALFKHRAKVEFGADTQPA